MRRWQLGISFALLLPAFGCERHPASTPGSEPDTAPPSEITQTSKTAPAAAANADAAVAGRAAPQSASQKPKPPFNVLLILVDSLRADMPWAGYERPIAPNLTELEKQSVSYTRAYSVSSYTAKSVAGLLSGKYPSALKRSGVFFTRYPESNLFFPELLTSAGIHTLSTQAHAYLKRGIGLDQGFLDWKIVSGITFDAQTDNHVTSHKLTPLVIEQLDAVPDDKRFFAYVHYMDPHDQYVRHKEAPDFGRKARDLYDQEVFYTDLWLGKLLDYCRSKPWWERTAVVVSADHGEAFGEHGMYRHAFELWEMLTHVPLFFRVPGAEPRRIDEPRGHIDIAPTVLELMAVTAEHDFMGKSLVPELFGAAPARRPVLLDLPADSNNPERRALIHGDYKLLVFGNDSRFDLYNLKTDPAEKNNLAKTEPERLAELKALYRDVWSKVPSVKPFGGNKLTGGGIANGPSK
jgi:choline-sulfatase